MLLHRSHFYGFLDLLHSLDNKNISSATCIVIAGIPLGVKKIKVQSRNFKSLLESQEKFLVAPPQ